MAKPPLPIRHWFLIFLLINAACAGCGQLALDSNTPTRLNCILLGNDSIACYYGSSKEFKDMQRGILADSAFMNAIIRDIKKQDSSLVISIKPTAASNVGMDLRTFIDLLKANDLNHRSIDTLDANEKTAFHATSLQEFIAETVASPMHLALPKDDGSNRSVTIEAPLASRLVVLIYGDSGIYAYMGNDINAGKQYSYPAFRKLLALKKKDPSLVVIIRASSSCTYRCNVNMLDEMTIAGIKKYQLVDITKPEEDFINRLKKNS